MAIQIEQTLNSNTKGTQAQVESLAAFLSDWSEDSLAFTPMTTPAASAKDEDDMRMSILLFDLRPSSPHLPAAPAPHLPSRTLRRRYKYIVAAETEVTTSLSLREQHRHYPNENGPLHQHREQETITTSNNMSPSCTRAALARSVGAEFTPRPIPPPPFLPVGATRPIDTE